MRRVPAILLVVLLVFPLFFAALVTIAVGSWAMDREFYVGLLSDERLYELPAGPRGSWSARGTGIDALSAASRYDAVRLVVTPAYMRSQALSAVTQVFDAMDGRASFADIRIDLVPVKEALKGDAGKAFARQLAKELPVGGSAAAFSVQNGRLPAARPASISVDRAAAIIEAGLPSFAAAIPDAWRLDDVDGMARVRIGGPGAFSVRAAWVLGLVILFGIAAGPWVAAAFVGGASPFERLQWLGWSLLAPAVSVFLLGMLTALGAFSGWASWGIAQAGLEAQGFAAAFVAALEGAARSAIVRAGTAFIVTGAVTAGAAFAFLGWSWSMPASARAPATTRDQGAAS